MRLHFIKSGRRFARAKEGAAAVEFALVLGPFIWLLLAIAEVTMIGFAQTSLDYAMSETSRRIRTGEVQSQNMSEAQLRQEICTELNRFLAMACNNLMIDVDSYDSFVAVANPNPLNANGTMNTSNFGYNPGQPSQIVLVRGFYQWNLVTPYFNQFFANVGSDRRLLTSTILFRNEPWPVAPTP